MSRSIRASAVLSLAALACVPAWGADSGEGGASVVCRKPGSDANPMAKVTEALKLAESGSFQMALSYSRLVQLPGQDAEPERKPLNSTLLCNLAPGDPLLMDCSDKTESSRFTVRTRKLQEKRLSQLAGPVSVETVDQVEFTVETSGAFFPQDPNDLNQRKFLFNISDCKVTLPEPAQPAT